MSDFIASEDRAVLERHGLACFEALWALKLEAVDEPNVERGGWSSVCRLELEGAAYYLKRQSNHLTRSLRRPLGEPTFAREFRNIRHYQQLGIPALQAAFFARRQAAGEQRAILLSRALDGWTDLYRLLDQWAELAPAQRQAMLHAVARLAARLHGQGQMHGCFYPKHIFLRATGEDYQACLIDLEKTRPLWFGKRDRVKDLEPLLRRTARSWSEAEMGVFLADYLGNGVDVEQWSRRLVARLQDKAARR